MVFSRKVGLAAALSFSSLSTAAAQAARHILLLVLVATSTSCLSEQAGFFSQGAQEVFQWLCLASFILLVLGAIVAILLRRKKPRHVVGSIVVGAGISFLVFTLLA